MILIFINLGTAEGVPQYVNVGCGVPLNQTINVLIYNGDYADEYADQTITQVLDYANENGLVPGYRFNYIVSTEVNSASLQSMNVLIMPGGDDYISDDNRTMASIDPDSVINFVKNGGGYVGICSGAFAGANYTQDFYRGWGVAPHVNCLQPYWEGTTSIMITPAGNRIMGKNGSMNTLYWNGPIMKINGNATVLATYNGVTDSDGNMVISRGNAAIVGDYYGKGRSVLIGTHLEEDPQAPDVLARLIVWSASLD